VPKFNFGPSELTFSPIFSEEAIDRADPVESVKKRPQLDSARLPAAVNLKQEQRLRSLSPEQRLGLLRQITAQSSEGAFREALIRELQEFISLPNLAFAAAFTGALFVPGGRALASLGALFIALKSLGFDKPRELESAVSKGLNAKTPEELKQAGREIADVIASAKLQLISSGVKVANSGVRINAKKMSALPSPKGLDKATISPQPLGTRNEISAFNVESQKSPDGQSIMASRKTGAEATSDTARNQLKDNADNALKQALGRLIGDESTEQKGVQSRFTNNLYPENQLRGPFNQRPPVLKNDYNVETTPESKALVQQNPAIFDVFRRIAQDSNDAVRASSGPPFDVPFIQNFQLAGSKTYNRGRPLFVESQYIGAGTQSNVFKVSVTNNPEGTPKNFGLKQNASYETTVALKVLYNADRRPRFVDLNSAIKAIEQNTVTGNLMRRDGIRFAKNYFSLSRAGTQTRLPKSFSAPVLVAEYIDPKTVDAIVIGSNEAARITRQGLVKINLNRLAQNKPLLVVDSRLEEFEREANKLLRRSREDEPGYSFALDTSGINVFRLNDPQRSLVIVDPFYSTNK
jgi:hypothetical protein